MKSIFMQKNKTKQNGTKLTRLFVFRSFPLYSYVWRKVRKLLFCKLPLMICLIVGMQTISRNHIVYRRVFIRHHIAYNFFRDW